MKNLDLVGCQELKFYAADLIYHKEVYHKTKLRIPHLILNVDRGDGQSTITHALSNFYKENKLCMFSSSDLYKEFYIDGTKSNMDEVFLRKGLDHAFRGVISLDLSGVVYWDSDKVLREFINLANHLSENNVMVVYMGKDIRKKQKELIDTLTSDIKGMRYIPITPYQSSDYAAILSNMINDIGVELEDPEQVGECFSRIITEREVENVSEIRDMAEELVFLADYSQFRPSLSINKVYDYMERDGVIYER